MQTIRFSPESHIALRAANIAVVEYKSGHWAKAEPLRMNPLSQAIISGLMMGAVYALLATGLASSITPRRS